MMPGGVMTIRQKGMALAEAVNRVIKKHGIEKQTVVVSKDPFKLNFLNRLNNDITLGIVTVGLKC